MIDFANVNFRQDTQQVRAHKSAERKEFARRRSTNRPPESVVSSAQFVTDSSKQNDNVSNVFVQTKSMSRNSATTNKQPEPAKPPPRRTSGSSSKTVNFISLAVESQCSATVKNPGPVAPPRRIRTSKSKGNNYSGTNPNNLNHHHQPVEAINVVVLGYGTNHPDVVTSIGLPLNISSQTSEVTDVKIVEPHEYVERQVDQKTTTTTTTSRSSPNIMDILNGLQCFDIKTKDSSYNDDNDPPNFVANSESQGINAEVKTCDKVTEVSEMFVCGQNENKSKKVSFSIKPLVAKCNRPIELVGKTKAASFPTAASTSKKLPLCPGGRYARQEKVDVRKGSLTSHTRMAKEFPRFSHVLSIPADNVLRLDDEGGTTKNERTWQRTDEKAVKHMGGPVVDISRQING